MVKVCHMTSAHDSDDVRIFKKECVSLAKAGYDVYLVAQGESREESGVHVVGLGEYAPESRMKRMTRFARKIYERALELDADIYHFHDPELLSYGLKLKKKGKTVIFDSHEDTLDMLLDKQFIPAPVRPAAAKVYKAHVANICKKLDAVITVTPHIIDKFKCINPNTVMVSNFPALREQREFEKFSKFTLCFTGGIDAQWSHDVIINAIKGFDAEYILCGSGAPEFLEYLKTLPDWDKIDYRGRVPFEQSIEIQNRSHAGMALLKPSRNTGFKTGTIGNTKLFEYMMAGIPVICTDFKLWQEIIDKYHCGICVNPEDSTAVSEAVKYIRDNPERAAEMGRNGRKAVEEEFNWLSQERNLLDLYKTLV